MARQKYVLVSSIISLISITFIGLLFAVPTPPVVGAGVRHIPKDSNSTNFTEDTSRIRPLISTEKCSHTGSCRQVTKNDTVLVLNLPQKAPKKQARKFDLNNIFQEDVPGYPEAEINEALRRTPESLRNYFNAIDTPLDPNRNLTERIAHNENFDEKEEPICRSVIRNIYPREARLDNSRVYVPNSQDFMQIISVEICQQANEDCNYLQGVLPEGFSSVCVQKYAYKKLLYLDPLEKRMASDMFRYPSCCSCHIKAPSFDMRSIGTGSKAESNQTSKLLDPSQSANLSLYDNSSNFSKLSISSNDSSETEKEISVVNLGGNTTGSANDKLRKAKSLTVEGETSSRRSNIVDTSYTTTRNPLKRQSLSQDDHNMTQTVVMDEDRVYRPQ